MKLTKFTYIILLLIISCAPTNKLGIEKSSDNIDFFSLPNNPQSINTLDGYCDIKSNYNNIRLSLHAEIENDTVNIALIDEIGLPLAQIKSVKNEVTIIRIMPPLKKNTAKKVGVVLDFYMNVLNKNLPKESIFISKIPDNKLIKIIRTDNSLDSIIIFNNSHQEYAFSFTGNNITAKTKNLSVKFVLQQ